MDALENIGLDKSKFGVHSLRSGGATFKQQQRFVKDCLRMLDPAIKSL